MFIRSMLLIPPLNLHIVKILCLISSCQNVTLWCYRNRPIFLSSITLFLLLSARHQFAPTKCSILNLGCRLIPVVLYNGRKRVLLLLGRIAVGYYCTIRVRRCGLLLPSIVVCRFVCRSVVSPAKMAEPIEVLFGLRTWVGPRNHVLDGGSDLPMEKGNFG